MPNLVANSRLTQKQIAEQLGVSRQLVGFALNGHGQVNERTRQRIIDFARENGYSEYSNREARIMASRRYGKRISRGVLAVLFHATFEGQPLSSVPFFAPFFQGLEQEALARGADLALCPLRPNELPLLVREGHVDGVVCLLMRDAAREVGELGLPVVSVQYEVPGIPSLVIEEAQGTTLAMRHLVGLGHRHIAYFGLQGRTQPFMDGRIDSYHRALKDNDLPVIPELVDETLQEPTIQAGEDAMHRLLERCRDKQDCSDGAATPGFSGLVCYNDLIAIGAVNALQEGGWRVPEDVSVVGFDDVSLQYGFRPAITSINFSRQQIGRRAVQLLCEQQEEAEASTRFASHIDRFPVQLMVRDSTAPVIN